MRTSLIVATLIAASAWHPGSTRAQDRAQMDQDAAQLHEAAERVRALEGLEELRLSESTIAAVGQNLPLIESTLARQAVAVRLAAQVGPFVDTFRTTYLSALPEWGDAANELGNRFGGRAPYHVGMDYVTVDEALRTIARAPAHNAARCMAILESVGTDEARIRDLHEIVRTRSILEARALLDVCPRFAPDDAAIAARAEALRPRVEAVLARFREEELAAIRDRSFPAEVGATSEGATALAYLRAHPLLAGDPARGIAVLAVAVRGDYAVAERDLFGRPTSYGLPVSIAITSPYTVEGVAQVLELTLITRDARPASPFDGYWVGNTWLMLRERVPGQAARAAQPQPQPQPNARRSGARPRR